MKIRYCSDLHTEFWGDTDFNAVLLNKVLPKKEDDSECLLILAGDIGTLNSLYFYETIKTFCERFKGVFYIPGNHEFYGGDIKKTWKVYKDWFKEFKNLYMDGLYEDDNLIIVGETLWTNFGNNDPLNLLTAQRRMNDYSRIKNDDKRLYSDQISNLHEEQLDKILSVLIDNRLADKSKKVVVVSHHSPSFQSTHPTFENDKIINTFYHSDLEYFINKYKPEFWIHGHTHFSFDYTIGKTKILCNPFGYLHYDNNAVYDSEIYIEV
jgi:UDP-2,3-diacylglucosamine pyrophosphatase LpxH